MPEVQGNFSSIKKERTFFLNPFATQPSRDQKMVRPFFFCQQSTIACPNQLKRYNMQSTRQLVHPHLMTTSKLQRKSSSRSIKATHPVQAHSVYRQQQSVRPACGKIYNFPCPTLSSKLIISLVLLLPRRLSIREKLLEKCAMIAS